MCYNYEEERKQQVNEQREQIQEPVEQAGEVQQEQQIQQVQQVQQPPLQQEAADPLQDFVMVEQMEAEPRTVRERLECRLEVRTEIDDQQDSRYMQAVKRALTDLAADTEHAMLPGDGTIDLTRERDGLHNKLNTIEEKYRDAIEKCDQYLEKREPLFFANLHKRYQSVKNTRELLSQELGYVTKLRHDITENPENYQGKQKVSFLDLAYELRKRNESVKRLEMKDYVKMLTDKDGESIVCRNGKLYRKDSGMAGSNPNGRTSENYDMLVRFLDLILERQNSFSETTRKKIRRNLLKSMGADLREKVAGPVNMGKIRELVVRFNKQVSEVDRQLLDKKEDSLAYQTAAGIQELLGSAFLHGKNQKGAESELQRRQQIAEIQATCQDYPDLVTLRLSKQEISSLVKGQLQAARDKAFQSAMKIYRMRERLGEKPPKPLEAQEMKLLLGMAISQVITEKEDVREALELQLRRFEREQALKADEALTKDLALLDVEELRTTDADSVRLYVEKHPKQWQSMPEEERKQALKALTRLMENMQELNTLAYKGLMQGLTPDESALFRKRLEENQTVFAGNRAVLDRLRKGFPQGSAMEEGLKKLYMRGELTGFGAKTDLAERISAKLVREEQQEAVQEAEPKALELISEEEAFSEALKGFPKKTRLLIRRIFLSKAHSSIIEQRGDAASRSLLRLHEAFATLAAPEHAEGVFAVNLIFQGIRMTLVRNAEGILTLRCAAGEVTLPYTASYWVGSLEEDLCTNFNRYQERDARRILLQAVERDEARPENERKSRVIYERFLTYQIGARAEELAVLTNQELRELTRVYCSFKTVTKERILEDIRTRSAQQNGRIHINSQAAIENLIALENRKQRRERPRVIKKEDPIQVVEDPGVWTKEEKSYLNLMGELYFSGKTKLTLDAEAAYTTDRLKEVLRNNSEDFLSVANMNLAKRTEMAMRLRPFKEQFSQAVTAFNNFLTSLATYFFFRKGFGAVTQEDLNEALESGGLDDMLNRASAGMAAAVDAIAGFVQEHLDEAVKDMVEDDEERWKSINDYTVEELVEKGITGDDGEGAFNKLVLSGYVRHASKADRQKMVACALKNAPKLTEKDAESARRIDMVMGKFMAGFVKGAGPLLHKMMQGIPISSMPGAMQEMVKDVRSNLMHIDEDIVDAQLQQIIDESNGAIDHIEKIKVLGAASVGETILVKMYESPDSEGVEKVVKILRPDVQNYMEREIAFMESCARKVDENAARKAAEAAAGRNGQAPQAEQQAPEGEQAAQEQQAEQPVQAEPVQAEQAQEQVQQPVQEQRDGGMLKTFRGKTASIRRELDLRLEADNVEKGKIYEDELLHIRSMRVDKNTKSTIHALVLEKAPGQSVDNFITAMNTRRQAIEEKVTGKKKKDENGQPNQVNKKAPTYDTLKELSALKKELQEKQKYLSNLTQKWLDEAIFGSGFFHGDLHAGNIMMDEDGVTVIDYGNVSKLEEKDQKNILNLMAAAMRYNNERVEQHIKAMLSSPEARRIFESKQAEFSQMIKVIVKKEDGSPVDKILAILNELQKNEIEIPAGFYNFIQCFVRIVGTMSDYTALIENVDRSMARVMEQKRFGNVENDPEAEVMTPIQENILGRRYYENENPGKLEDVQEKAIFSTELDMKPLLEYCEMEEALAFKSDLISRHDKMYHFADLCHRITPILNKLFLTDDSTRLIFKINRGETLTRAEFEVLRPEWYELNIRDSFAVTVEGYIHGRVKRGLDETKQAHLRKIRALEDEKTVLEMRRDAEIHGIAGWQDDLAHETDPRERENLQRIIATEQKKLETYQQGIAETDQDIAVLNGKIQELDARQAFNEQQIEPLTRRAEALVAQFDDIFAHPYNQANMQNAVNSLCEMLTDLIELEGRTDLEKRYYRAFMAYAVNPVHAENEDEAHLDAAERERRRIQRQEAEQRGKRLADIAQEVHQSGDPKSYRDQVVDVVTNQEKLRTFGENLKSWFADKETKGEELKRAYDQVTLFVGQQQEAVDRHAPEVEAFVEAYLTSLRARVARIDAMMTRKKDGESEAEKALFGLVAGSVGRVCRTLKALDYVGLPYIWEYKMEQQDRDALMADTKRRKSNYMEGLFRSLAASGLKEATGALKSASAAYTRLQRLYNERGEEAVGRNDLRDAKRNLERSIQGLLKSISKIRFGKGEAKKLEDLARTYETDPTPDTLLDLIREVGLYLDREFKGTRFADTNPNPNAVEGEPQYMSQVFDIALTKLDILPSEDYLKLEYQERKGADGKVIPLLQRLRSGETISWMKAEQ